MITEEVEAVYEQGIFRIVAPVDLKLEEGQKVRLVVQPIEKPDDILDLAVLVYEGLTDEQINAIEAHSRRREDFFNEGTRV